MAGNRFSDRVKTAFRRPCRVGKEQAESWQEKRYRVGQEWVESRPEKVPSCGVIGRAGVGRKRPCVVCQSRDSVGKGKGRGYTSALCALFRCLLGSLEGSVPLHGLGYGPDHKAVDALATGLCVGLDFILPAFLHPD